MDLDSRFQSFAGSLIIQAGLQIPKPRTPDSNSKNQRKKSSQILDSINKDFPIPESGVPDMGQSTVSYWIVGTQVSGFAGRKTKQKTEYYIQKWLTCVIDAQGRG